MAWYGDIDREVLATFDADVEIIPYGDCILVEPIYPDGIRNYYSKTVLMPDQERPKPDRVKVLAVGEDVTEVSVGDTAIIEKRIHQPVAWGDRDDLQILREGQVLARETA